MAYVAFICSSHDCEIYYGIGFFRPAYGHARTLRERDWTAKSIPE
jgi:hypothetical protein